MKIKFTGTLDIPDGLDSQGDADVWVIWKLKEILENGPELDDIYENLDLDWDVLP